jgi:radical SAM superfamily enzyme with C-terminal helix-hairpin-helix motif
MGPGTEGDLRAATRCRRARHLAAAALAVVAGCATPGPTVAPPPAPAEIREVRADAVSRCRLLGPVEASHANAGSVALNELEALETARSRVAKLGGNAFLVTRRDSGMWRTVIQADAYLCPSWEPVPGLPPG